MAEDPKVPGEPSQDPEAALRAVRAEIDALDQQLQHLIEARARCAQRVAAIKRVQGESNDFFRPEREAEVLNAVRARNDGPLDDAAMSRLFREIMSACLALQTPLKVGYLGPRGTFSQAATLQHFGHAVDAVGLGSIEELFHAVQSERVAYSVVPVENSTEGAVNQTLDLLMHSRARVCGEVALPIHHHLLSRASALADVRRVYSHYQSLAQCRRWLDRNLPQAERVAVSSNAEAARRAAGEPDAAAVAGDLAAEHYGLPALARNVEDEPDNTTRFVVLGLQEVAPTGRDKTSLLVTAPNRPGALYRLMEPFARYDINMIRIESRPSRRGVWDYVFFIDLEGHAQEEPVKQALAALNDMGVMVRVLGAYPRAEVAR